ncbi:hypothetical protein GAMM_230002 [Gammaproteobacteria bacterium]
MKTVTFVKEHPVGINEGRTIMVSDSDAKRWKEEGYVTIDGDAGEDEPEMIDHVLTKKDLRIHPEWFVNDNEVGDTIQIPNPKYIQ